MPEYLHEVKTTNKLLRHLNLNVQSPPLKLIGMSQWKVWLDFFKNTYHHPKAINTKTFNNKCKTNMI